MPESLAFLVHFPILHHITKNNTSIPLLKSFNFVSLYMSIVFEY